MKRIMSILLAFVMLSSALEAFAAVSYNDVTDEHWAAEYIEQLPIRVFCSERRRGIYFPKITLHALK